MTDSVAALLRLLAVVAVIAIAWFFGDRIVAAVRAPVQAQLSAAEGNNAALKAGSDAQTAGVRKLAEDGKVRQERSTKAVEAAGKPHLERAKAIGAAPAVGDTDYDRAINRIDRELGLK